MIDPMKVWAGMTIKVRPGAYWMIDLDGAQTELVTRCLAASGEHYACVIRDQGGLSLVVADAVWRAQGDPNVMRERFGPFRIVSTDGELPFGVIGFLHPLLRRLNEMGIKAGPQCGAIYDHLFIYETKIDEAVRLIEAFIAEAASLTRDGD